MKNISAILKLPIFGLCLLLSTNVFALDFPDKPGSRDFFVDEAGLIDDETAWKIDLLAANLLEEQRVALFVVTIPSMSRYAPPGYSIATYARKLFDHWGIGFKDRNYGMLLLVAKGDRKARIELGADWGRGHDKDAEQIMETLIIPAFKDGDYSLGILQGAQGLDAMARGLQLPQPAAPWWMFPVIILLYAGLIVLIFDLFRKGRSGLGWALIMLVAVSIIAIVRDIYQSSGTGFDDWDSSGGFGGDGGGSSGGGGASGSW